MPDTETLPPLPIDWNDFTQQVSVILRNLSLLSKVPVAGERWEEVLVAVFRRMGITVAWTAGSHAQGTDIALSKDGHNPIYVSVKAGGIKNRKVSPDVTRRVLNFSSYRTTSYETLEAKLDFIDADSKQIDWYLFAARDETVRSVRKYQIYLAKSSIFQVKEATWKVTKAGWRGEQINGIVMTITKSMSDQLWLDIPLSLLTHGAEDIHGAVEGALVSTIEIPVSELGSRIDLLFSPLFATKVTP